MSRLVAGFLRRPSGGPPGARRSPPWTRQAPNRVGCVCVFLFVVCPVGIPAPLGMVQGGRRPCTIPRGAGLAVPRRRTGTHKLFGEEEERKGWG